MTVNPTAGDRSLSQQEGTGPAALSVSFEFFPPKSAEMEEKLWTVIERLAPLQPKFVSVTYGAGGTTRERTHATVRRIRQETALEPAAHLTCIGADRGEIDAIVRDYWDHGIRHLVALRGDIPADYRDRYPSATGYNYASELVAGIRRVADFEISVAAYPEGHPESDGIGAELDNLKRKIDAGATRAITQFFFDAETYCRFLDRALAAGITVPIVPGILPVTNFAQTVKFAALCGASIPSWMSALFSELDTDPETRRLVAASVAVELCQKLAGQGVRDFHFYTMNRADLTVAICHRLGIRTAVA